MIQEWYEDSKNRTINGKDKQGVCFMPREEVLNSETFKRLEDQGSDLHADLSSKQFVHENLPTSSPAEKIS